MRSARHRLFLPGIILLVWVAVAGLSPTYLHGQDLAPSEMEEDLEQMRQVVGRAWAHLEDKGENFGVNIEEIFEQAKSRLGEVGSKKEFVRLLEECVASLKDGHARVACEDVETWGSWQLPFEIAEVREGIGVSWVPPAEAQKYSVRRGQLIEEIGAQRVEEAMESAARRTFASTPGMRRRKGVQKLRWQEGPRVRIRFRSPGAESRLVSVRTVPRGSLPLPAVGMTESVSHRLVDPSMGYLQIATFDLDQHGPYDPTDQEERNEVLSKLKAPIRKAFLELESTDTMILDLRGNGGGGRDLGKYVAQHLMQAPFVYHKSKGRLSPELSRLLGGKGVPTTGWTPETEDVVAESPEIEPYDGRLILLADEGCFSATDILVACLSSLHPDITIIGRPTGGGAGIAEPVATLRHSRAVLTLPLSAGFDPEGCPIEGRGTQPDIPIEWTLSDIVEGRDPDLEAAIKEARERTFWRKPSPKRAKRGFYSWPSKVGASP